MKFLFPIFWGFIAGTCAASRIIGGKDAPEGKYPYMVSLKNGKSYACGGSILDKRWILTTGSCIIGAGPNAVVAGTNLLEGGNEQVYQSEYVATHKNWNNPLYSNDVALIRVNKDIEFNDKVQPVKLPKEDFNKVGHPVVLTGWGTTELGGSIPNTLQEITLQLFDQEQCIKVMDIVTINQSHICTYTKFGEGICHGDSGSPLVVDGVQIGIASILKQCAAGYPDVYARVYTFLDWIAEEQAKF